MMKSVHSAVKVWSTEWLGTGRSTCCSSCGPVVRFMSSSGACLKFNASKYSETLPLLNSPGPSRQGTSSRLLPLFFPSV